MTPRSVLVRVLHSVLGADCEGCDRHGTPFPRGISHTSFIKYSLCRGNSTSGRKFFVGGPDLPHLFKSNFPDFRTCGVNFEDFSGVADPVCLVCLSQILICVHPGSRVKKRSTKDRGKKISWPTSFCSRKYHKFENYFIVELVKTFYPKHCN